MRTLCRRRFSSTAADARGAARPGRWLDARHFKAAPTVERMLDGRRVGERAHSHVPAVRPDARDHPAVGYRVN
jgi:hypothetical protein